jgi:hypothetical protein
MGCSSQGLINNGVDVAAQCVRIHGWQCCPSVYQCLRGNGRWLQRQKHRDRFPISSYGETLTRCDAIDDFATMISKFSDCYLCHEESVSRVIHKLMASIFCLTAALGGRCVRRRSPNCSNIRLTVHLVPLTRSSTIELRVNDYLAPRAGDSRMGLLLAPRWAELVALRSHTASRVHHKFRSVSDLTRGSRADELRW